MDSSIRLVALLSSITLLGCITHPPPDYESSNGVKYFWKGAEWDTQQIEQQEDFFLENLFNLNRFSSKKVMETLSHIHVDLYADPIPCSGSPTGKCNGQQINYLLQVRDVGCPFNSALTHEMTHAIQAFVGRTEDYYHKDVELWKVADTGAAPCNE